MAAIAFCVHDGSQDIYSKRIDVFLAGIANATATSGLAISAVMAVIAIGGLVGLRVGAHATREAEAEGAKAIAAIAITVCVVGR